ncbi:MAG: molybdate ABC transporter substrate-binding protein [Candidatus Sulfotelmatobacter sp.]
MKRFLVRALLVIAGCGLAAFYSVAQDKDALQPGSSMEAAELAIAAPDELNSPLTDLARQFEQKTGTSVHFSFADEASLLKQIRSGSAFDAVFLEEMNDARRLVVSGALSGASVIEYARDSIALCFGPSIHIKPRFGNPLLLLTDKRVPLVAIASPHTAFGKITLQALSAVHIYDPEFKRKLVVAQDVAEAAQLLKQGRADAALLPGSAIRMYQLSSLWVLPIDPIHVYTPVAKGAGMLRRSKHSRLALEFLRFAASPEGRAIFRKAGFDEPQRFAKLR